MNGLRLVLITFPTVDSARQIGTLLVEMQLTACVNLIQGVESVYRWQGNVESTTEVLALFKTNAAVLPEFERVIQQLHPYELPEFVVIEPSSVSSDYLGWVLDATKSTGALPTCGSVLPGERPAR